MRMKSRIIFRADGNSRIGLGHVTRSLALAHMLRDEYECVFAIQAPDAILKEQILNTCHGVIVLPACLSSEERFNHELDAYISDEEIVVLDGYSFDAKYQENVKARGAILVCIDDLHNYHFVADAVINQAGGVDANLYQRELYTKLLLGPEFALLRPPFLEAAKSETDIKERDSNLFLCMGGADPANYTLQIAQEISKLYEDITLEIVVGSAYKHHQTLSSWLNENQQHRLHENLNADAVCELMQRCPAAVTSASGVAYEYAAVGGALFILKTADNQLSLYKYLLDENLAKEYKSLSDEKKNTTFSTVFTELIQHQRQVFDGHSGDRLKNVFSKLNLQTRLKIRKASKDDLILLFNWANDPVVRSHSFNTAPIPLEIHTSWFSSKLDNPDCILYIAEVEKEPAAHIRFEITDNVATISYLISESYRGNGLGHSVLLKGLKQLLTDRKDINSIIGLVQKENKASVRAFEKAGFQNKAPDPLYPDAFKFTMTVQEQY